MNSSYRMKESPSSGQLKAVPACQTRRFKIFAGIVVATALLLSTIAISRLSFGVNNVTQKKVPMIENQIDKLPTR